MIPRSFSLFVVLGVLALGRADAAGSSPRRLTLDQALAHALAHSTKLQKSRHQLEAVAATRRATRGQFLPKLSVEGNVFVWDDEVAFDLTPDASSLNIDPACLPTLGCLAPLLTSFDVGPVREQVTAQLTVQVIQPITPLYAIYHGYTATKEGEKAARSGVVLSRNELIAAVKQQYIQLKQAEGGVQIARTAVKRVEIQLEKARQFVKAGLLGRNDLLKLEVARARAAGGLLKAQSGWALAQSALALTAGFPPSEPIAATERFADPPPRFSRTLDECYRQALKSRPELSAVQAQAAIAKATKKAASGAMIPQLVGLGAYQHNEGQGFVMPKNVWFAGASLKWDIWSWGADYYRIKEAQAKVKSSDLDVKALTDGIYLQVKKSFLDLQTAHKELAIGKVAVKQAEESYRIEKSKYDNNSATTADLINAEAALSLAQQTYNNSLYGWYLAMAALEQAMGQPALKSAR